MKIKDVIIFDQETGDPIEQALDRPKFIAYILENNEVKEFVTGEGTPDERIVDAKNIVEMLLDTIEAGQELPESHQGDYGEVFDFIKDAISASQDYKDAQSKAEKEEREKKKKEREEAKKAKEEAKAALAKRQNIFMTGMEKGADSAMKDLKSRLEKMSKALPDGVSVIPNDSGTGYGLKIEKDADEKKLAQATGYFLQQADNDEFMKRTSAFIFGELCNDLVGKKLFRSATAAAKHIAENSGGRIKHQAIQMYARLADRIPFSARNGNVLDKCYLTLSNAKLPEKQKDEDKDSYKARIAAHKADRDEIANKLASGEIDPDDTKKVKELVHEMQVKHGIAKEKDPDTKTTAQYLKEFFIITRCLESFVGSYGDDDAVVFVDADGDEYSMTINELRDQKQAAESNLDNVLIEFKLNKHNPCITVADIEAGQAEIKVPKIDAKGKEIKDEFEVKTRKVAPRPFWPIEPKPKEKAEADSDKEEE